MQTQDLLKKSEPPNLFNVSESQLDKNLQYEINITAVNYNGFRTPSLAMKNSTQVNYVCLISFRSVVDTVYSIRDQIVLLSHQNKEVMRMLEDEISARKRLEAFVRAHVGGTNNHNHVNNNTDH